MLKYIEMIYKQPKFSVKTNDNKSDFLRQHTGIRQGCPLSPYLFILLMTIMFIDIKDRLNTPAQREPFPGIQFSEILYADDTLLFGKNTLVLKKLLKEIQKESIYYNLKLNYDKCINLTMNRVQSNITYQNGDLVPRKPKAVYLGTLLTDTNDNHAEINNRISDSIVTANKLKLFWNKANTTIKWKLQVFDAIIRSKLLYGLETMQLTQNEKLRIDAHQMKGIRRILNIPPTHVDRTWTNELVMKKANEEADMKGNKQILKFTEMWKRLKFKLLGHLLRADYRDPLHQITFKSILKEPRLPIKRRVGRPRDQWIVETMKEAFEHLKIVEEQLPREQFTPLDLNNYNQIDQLVGFANQRTGMFATKPPKFNRNVFQTTNSTLDKNVNFVSEHDPYNLMENSNNPNNLNRLIIPAAYYQFLE